MKEDECNYMKKLTMLVVTHKQTDIPNIDSYNPIVVGNNNVFLKDMYRDNSGDNISDKNANYCELTALYWAWKNLNDVEYVGLSHYRRFFMTSFFNHTKSGFLSAKKAITLLNNYDVILPYPKGWFDTTVEEWFLSTDGKTEALEKLKFTITDLYPDYLDDYDKIMNGYMASYFNMFVMSKELMDKYCGWLFSILFELEKQIDLSTYTPLQARIYGFLSERLLNVWVCHNKLRIKYMFVNEIEKDSHFKSDIKDILKYNAISKNYLKWMTVFKWGNMKK